MGNELTILDLKHYSTYINTKYRLNIHQIRFIRLYIILYIFFLKQEVPIRYSMSTQYSNTKN